MTHFENLTTPVELLVAVCYELARRPSVGVGSGLLIESDGLSNFDISVISAKEWCDMSDEDRAGAVGYGYIEIEDVAELPSLCEMYFC